MNRNSRSGLSTQHSGLSTWPSALFLCFLASILLLSPATAFCGEIHDAAYAGDLNKVEALLKSDPSLVNAKSSVGELTALHYAAAINAKDVVVLLLAKGAQVNANDNDRHTPLNLAACSGAVDAAGVLLAQGADPNAKECIGNTPLHQTVAHRSENSKDIAALLLAKGADANAKNNIGKTPLHLAAVYRCKDIAELLIAKGADVNAKDNHAWTPLHCVAQQINVATPPDEGRIAELLLAKGADVNVRDDRGKTPLSIAVQARNETVANVLRKHGAKE